MRVMIIASGSMTPAIGAGSVVVTFPQNRYYPGQVMSYYLEEITSSNNAGISNTPSPIAHQKSDSIQFGLNKLLNHPSSIVTHRVVSTLEINHQIYYRTKGDANDYYDLQLVKSQNVIGRVWIVLPLVGFVLFLFYHPLSLLLASIIIFFWFFINLIEASVD